MKTYKISGNYLFQRSILNTVLIAALFLAVTLSPQAYSHGQGTEISAEAVAATAEQKNQAKYLTQQLNNLTAEYKAADKASSSSLANQLTTLAEERRQLLFDLMENDPAFVLNMTLPDLITVGLPESLQNLFEQTEEVEGELVVLHVDAKQSRYEYYLNTPSGERLSLYFAASPPGLVSGTTIRAHGVVFNRSEAHAANKADGTMLIDSGNTGILILGKGSPNAGNTGGSSSGTLSSTLGEQRTLVILVNFQDNQTQPYTAAFAQNIVFGATSDFVKENSFQQTWLNGDVVGWFTIDLSSTVCDIYTLASQAKSAATASGVNLSNYTHYVYAFSQNGCGGLGMGTVGGNPSEAWIIGTLNLDVVSHELGHNLGLYHAHALECGNAILGSSCTIMEYGDPFDAMGNKEPGHYNAYMKESLGWLNSGISPDIVTVASDGTYTLDTYENVSSGPKALKILKSTDSTTGAKTWYYIESRQAIGFDSFLSSNTSAQNGVLIHMATDNDANSDYLLDITPGSQYLTTTDWLDPALVVGQSYVDTDTGITVTTDSVTTTGATVTVMLSGGGGTMGTSLPTISVSTDSSTYIRSQTVTITTQVNLAGAPVANATVNFSITKSNGSQVTGTATTGSNGIAVYNFRLRKQDPTGVYNAAAAVTNGNATTVFTVM